MFIQDEKTKVKLLLLLTSSLSLINSQVIQGALFRDHLPSFFYVVSGDFAGFGDGYFPTDTPPKEKEKHKARNSLGLDEIVRIIEGPDKREYEY